MAQGRKLYTHLASGAIALFACATLHAETRLIDVPAGSMQAALDTYARQTGVQLIYRFDDIKDRASAGVKGNISPEEALAILIKGTPLQMRRDATNAVIIFRPEKVTDMAPAPAPSPVVNITGSRLKSAELVSDGPLNVVTSREIELQGTTNIENMLNNLPQMTASQSGSQSTYGTPGTATLNLRNLGPQRTMVLIDGRRMVPGDPVFPYPDVNFIPAGLVESIDVVSGGASAVYGSDAVAGVVNFKMKRNFDGVKFDYLGSIASHDNHNAAAQTALKNYGLAIPGHKTDGASNTLSLIAGRNLDGGKGNMTAYFNAVKTDPVRDSARDWAACGIGTNSIATANDTHLCQGSSNSAFGRFRTNGTGTGYANNPDGSASFVPYSSAKMGYNSNDLTYLQRADERQNAGVFAHYEVSPKIDLYADLMYMRDKTASQISPSGVTNNHTYTINCDNPLLTPAQATALCGSNAGSQNALWKGTIGYRFADGGPRIDHLEHRSSRVVIGARGEWNEHWGYDIYGQHSQVQYSDNYINDVSISRIQNALLVKNVNGIATCTATASGSDKACTPLNIFQLGKAATAYNYLYEDSESTGEVSQNVFSASIHGDLDAWGGRSPWASKPIALAMGSEWRRDTIDLRYSDALIAGDLSGTGARQPASGQTTVKEFFGELGIPLVEAKPWIKSLQMNAGYRIADYDRAGSNHTYKLGIIYTPSDNFTLRTGYNRAVRAPNIVELFAPQLVATAGGNDPCAGPTPTASLASCMNSGVTKEQYGKIADCSSGYCSSLSGGNTALKPEEADTYTAGLVFTPGSLRNFSATVDYFNIKVKDMIGRVASSLILSECLNNANPYYCSLIHRNASGSIASDDGYTLGTNQNTGFQHLAGIDLGVSYRFKLSDIGLSEQGRISTAFNGTWLQYQKTQAAPNQSVYDCAGLYGPTCGVPAPTWRHNLRITWEMPAAKMLSLNWRYIGKTTLDANSGNPIMSAAGGGKYNIADSHIARYSYWDLAGSMNLRDNIKLRIGINNLLDKDPPVLDNYNFPIITTMGNGNTYSGLYSTLGRVAYLGLSVDF